MVHFKFNQMLDFVKTHYPEVILSEIDKAKIVVSGEYTVDDYYPSHEAVVIPYTGHNKIDLALLKDKGLKLFNTQTHSKYVAERALALTLALMGKLIILHKNISKGNWVDPTKSVRESWDSLYELKIGFFGYGSISQYLKPLLEPFTNHFYTLDRGKLVEGVTLVSDLEMLVETCDVIYIATPLTAQTEGIFNETLLSKMKNKVLVNVARGLIVNEDDLYQALKDKTLKGYASDVWFRYPSDNEILMPSKYDLSVFDNVVMTPHNASFTEKALKERYIKVIDTIFSIQKGDYEEALDIDKILSYEVLK